MRSVLLLSSLTFGCTYIWEPPDLVTPAEPPVREVTTTADEVDPVVEEGAQDDAPATFGGLGVRGRAPVIQAPTLAAELSASLGGFQLEVTFDDPDQQLTAGELHVSGEGYERTVELADAPPHQTTTEVFLPLSEPACDGVSLSLDVWGVTVDDEVTPTVTASLSLAGYGEGDFPDEYTLDALSLPALWCGRALAINDDDVLRTSLSAGHELQELVLDWEGDEMVIVSADVTCVDGAAAGATDLWDGNTRPYTVQVDAAGCSEVDVVVEFFGTHQAGRDYWLLMR
ncbi:MAG: hypothetical protein KTR31_34745 [Myxococcales bacterium]|nr:hypothetical protein [Myxococcales bacterium]